MASARKLWLIALMSSSLSLLVQSVPTRREQPLDEIILPPSVPAKIRITDKPADPAGRLVKLRYGPFVMRPNAMFTPLPEYAGGPKIHKPCDECYLGAFQGGIEYEDGSDANVDTGVYLHHFVVVNNNKPDWLCPGFPGGRFRPQYIYNSGNERPPVRLNSKYNFGMRVDKEDTFSAMTEILNMSNETKTVYTTVIYEVIPLNTPGYKEATHLRIDIWMCGGSHIPAKIGAYNYTSPEYTSQYAGVILHNDGHGHSGTTDVNLFINGRVYCNSVQYYGLRRGTIQPPYLSMQHDPSLTNGMAFISDAGACEDYGRLEKGDVLRTQAFYNETLHPQLKLKGHLDGQMGINFLYIGRDEEPPNGPLTWSALSALSA